MAKKPFTGARKLFFKLFPDEQTEMVNVMEDGEWAVWEWQGWNPRDRTKTVLHGCGFFRVVDGRIVTQRGCWDRETFERGHHLRERPIGFV